MSHERFVTSTDEEYFEDIKRALLVGSQYGNMNDNNIKHIDDFFNMLQN